MYKHKNGIEFRKLEESDLPKLKDLKDESWFGTHTTAIVNMTDQKKWFDSLGNNQLMLIAHFNKSVVGLFKITNIDWMNRKCDMAHDIFKEYRGYGFGYKIVEAGVDFVFEVLNMNRIDAEVLENNHASLKTLENAGFKQFGVKEMCIYKCGDWLDSICVGILRKDWSNLTRVKEYGLYCNESYKPKNG